MKVVISGYGKMGHCIEKILRERNVEILATAEDIKTETPANAKEAVCIDFLHRYAFKDNTGRQERPHSP